MFSKLKVMLPATYLAFTSTNILAEQLLTTNEAPPVPSSVDGIFGDAT